MNRHLPRRHRRRFDRASAVEIIFIKDLWSSLEVYLLKAFNQSKSLIKTDVNA